MIQKPRYLGPEFGAQFKDESIVEAYRYRPPYPTEIFDILADLISSEEKTVLDIGCGDGNLARHLICRVDKIDAVDFSRAMIEQGMTLPGGDHPNLNWIHSPVEEAPLTRPYGLITAGQSLHWMDWDVVFPRFQTHLIPGGYLAIVFNDASTTVWDDDIGDLIRKYSTNKDYRPYDIVTELRSRDLFEVTGERQTTPTPYVQTVDAYVESWHSRNGLSRERLNPREAEAFDRQVHALVSSTVRQDVFEMFFTGRVVWGVPKSPFNQPKSKPSDE